MSEDREGVNSDVRKGRRELWWILAVIVALIAIAAVRYAMDPRPNRAAEGASAADMPARDAPGPGSPGRPD